MAQTLTARDAVLQTCINESFDVFTQALRGAPLTISALVGGMNTDFLDAHERHWRDAKQLFLSQRWANADHLFGLAAECGLKWLMLKFDMAFDKGRPTASKDRVHADGIWDRFESYRSSHAQGASYILPEDNPFHDWKISQRYVHQAEFDQARTDGHRTGANAVHDLIRQAQREGLI